MNNRYCVIMAGGIGSRFWPLSKEDKPKQFIDIFGTGRTFIQQTFERFNSIIPTENFIVVTSDKYKDIVLEQLPQLSESQILCEPIRRNTAPCIAYAAYHIAAKDKDAVMVVSPSDHIVTNQHLFEEVISYAMDFAENNDALMTIGIKPDRPETGYGYIQTDSDDKRGNVCRVKTFTEKPNIETAKLFVESGEFFWNSGIFLWSGTSIMKAMKENIPEVVSVFDKGIGTYNTPGEQAFINNIYPECKNISIDYAVMERAKNVFVSCADFGWSDVGTWGSLFVNSQKDSNNNVGTNNNIITNVTYNTIIKVPKGKKVVIDGLDNYIVVDSEDALLIYPKDKEQEIRAHVELL